MKKVEAALESLNKFLPSLKKGKFVLSDKVSVDIFIRIHIFLYIHNDILTASKKLQLITTMFSNTLGAYMTFPIAYFLNRN